MVEGKTLENVSTGRIEMTQEALYIGGQWVKSDACDLLEVRSPATGRIVGSAPSATRADVDRAVLAARRTFDDPRSAWRRMDSRHRAEAMRAVAREITLRRDEMAAILCHESGQPFQKKCLAQVDISTRILNYYADLAETFAFEERREGFVNPFIVRKEPVGVAALIAPWNAPLGIAAFGLGPALAAGCTVVLKPAPETPLHAFLLGKICEAAGLPPGVLNIVPADREASEALVRHPGIDKVGFTGSTATGRKVGSICGDRLKRCTLELGGKSAAIILEDAHLESVVPSIVATALQNSGEACVGQTRTLVPMSRYDEIIDAVTSAVAGVKVGDPWEPDTDIGPLISEKQRQRVEGYIELGRIEGARIAAGGGRPAGLSTGWFVEATVFADVDNAMRLAREEIFGPVMSLIPYRTQDDAIAIANDSAYGLSGSVWTANLQRGLDIARQVRTGNFGVNFFNLDIAAPFGGFKESGIGRQLGPEGMEGFVEVKTMNLPPATS